MKVLSLFDGISCGRIALDRASINVERYDAYEIDSNAIKISKKNYPDIIQHGDVTKADFTQYEGYDLLIGGSPCQGFSFSGKKLNFDDPRSKLFFEYVRALKESKPKYFLLENVKMKKEYEEVITEMLGVTPVLINSRSLTAQNRPRLYWTNIPVGGVEERHLTTTDILETEEGFKEVADRYLEYSNFYVIPRGSDGKLVNGNYNRIWKVGKICGALSVCKTPFIGYEKGGHIYSRQLTIKEAERLQTVPEDYTKGVIESARYKALGNGWTVDVIAHIFNGLKINKTLQQ